MVQKEETEEKQNDISILLSTINGPISLTTF